MNAEKNIHEEQADSKLRKQFGEEMPYEVPGSYFEDNPDRMLDMVRRNAGRKKYFLLNTSRRIAASAAIFVIAALALMYIFSNNNDIEGSLTEINYSDVYWHSISSLAELEESYLISLVDTDSLNIQTLMAPDTTDISDEAIIEYLLAENHIEYLILSEY